MHQLSYNYHNITISLNKFNALVFVMEKHCYSALGKADLLNTGWIYFMPQSVKQPRT